MARSIKLREGNIYGCLKMLPDDGRHITFNYKPGTVDAELLPNGIKEGDEAQVRIVGLYMDDDIIVLHVNVIRADMIWEYQLDNETALHITINSGHHAPVEAGRRLSQILTAQTLQEKMAKKHFYTKLLHPMERVGRFEIVRSDQRMFSKSEKLI